MSETMEKAKALLGHLLRGVHSSTDKLAGSHANSVSAISITSPSFQPNMPIPKKYTQDDLSISPALNWTGIPSGARELVLVVEDPDAPMPNPVVHWIVYNIPPTTMSLPERIPLGETISGLAGARQGRNYSKKDGYIGPKPPVGHGVHHYHFQLFALDTTLNLNHPTKDDLEKAMKDHVIAQGELIGTYERVGPE